MALVFVPAILESFVVLRRVNVHVFAMSFMQQDNDIFIFMSAILKLRWSCCYFLDCLRICDEIIYSITMAAINMPAKLKLSQPFYSCTQFRTT